MWMGAVLRCGYSVANWTLVFEDGQAEYIPRIFARLLEVGSGMRLAREVAKRGISTPHVNRIDTTFLSRILDRRPWIDVAVHVGEGCPGPHVAIIDRRSPTVSTPGNPQKLTPGVKLILQIHCPTQ
jgi:hypothetical protein